MTTPFEEEYLDVLQNIEAAIVSVYREHAELMDADVKKALNALLLAYQAEQKNQSSPPPAFKPSAQQVYQAVRQMCEWRLGRGALKDEETRTPLRAPEPLRLDEVLACLKRIRKSVQKWNKRNGERGYLQFVDQFIT